MTISTANFGSLSSLADLTSFVPVSNETNFIDYLVQRGYIIDGNLRAAPFDWRLGAGMQLLLHDFLLLHCTIQSVQDAMRYLVKLLVACRV